MYIPYFVAAVGIVLCIVALIFGRRRQLSLASCFGGAILSTIFIDGALYLDPSATVWRILGPVRAALGYAGAACLDLIILGAGAWLVAKRIGDPRSLDTPCRLTRRCS